MEEIDVSIDRLVFEITYPDEPEMVEFSVDYQRKPYFYDESIIGFVNIKHIDEITIPIDKVYWLIKTLQRSLEEHNNGSQPAKEGE